MKCQMLNCNNKAVVWSRYDGSDDFAMCQDCADYCKVCAENPDLCQTLPLTPEVEKLLAEMRGSEND